MVKGCADMVKDHRRRTGHYGSMEEPMTDITYRPIGAVRNDDGGFAIEIDPGLREGLLGLEGFSHLLVCWHADQGSWSPDWLTMPKPYRLAPERLGVFATRSPMRPNPVCLSIVEITGIDRAAGRIGVAWIDAAPGTPVLDLKPWLACCERPRSPRYPEWCRHWPATVEDSGGFDWGSEFRFG
jgi:tRNA-Thr(GGU) m(6)t(6)A37 methyltransferase TsaA